MTLCGQTSTQVPQDRKSTRLNSSHLVISYAVFCLKKKILAVLLQGVSMAQDLSQPFAPGDRFSISHTPMSAKLVPLDCTAKQIPVHSYFFASNEATSEIPTLSLPDALPI